MSSKLVQAAAAAALMTAAAPAAAHFQLVYTPKANLDRPGHVPFRLVFWHPMENGHVMDMGEPEAFFYRFRGERTDLTDTLKPLAFRGRSNAGDAYEANVSLRRSGDYVFTVVPEPYFEGSEDIYIQQIAKACINRGGVPTDWAEPVGLPTEIVPLNKPYNVVAGSTFSGVVLSEGEPVAGAEIEIEYMPAEPDLETNRPDSAAAAAAPGGTLAAVTDAAGRFTFGIPEAGWWGFAALGTGPETEHQGKPLSQDAVLWVRAHTFD